MVRDCFTLPGSDLSMLAAQSVILTKGGMWYRTTVYFLPLYGLMAEISGGSHSRKLNIAGSCVCGAALAVVPLRRVDPPPTTAAPWPSLQRWGGALPPASAPRTAPPTAAESSSTA
eukprot:CAMPEP_0173388566 /NCGR_PEP_ID=MMETSP1356-20130122/10844_1 /TAXON_ID=77927 ORGANISM="Hemiselmis virescens, Strain PCC157" /NCGR_SAMPLE_ID=MMETSP1356 /ASSEMBLY_ACC=CAM_ASM_000847 /LENGTH=115 /DNA_ID=CAMNT_0014345505 /DNA_START=136 /DNA_END=480 /DNA_ORIENTATION=-